MTPLLIDAHYSPAVAHALRARGHDAVAAVDDPALARLPDRDLFAFAQSERRAVLTENVRDFVPLAHECLRSGTEFHGLVLTSNVGYPRARGDTLGRLVKALDELMREHPRVQDMINRIVWL